MQQKPIDFNEFSSDSSEVIGTVVEIKVPRAKLIINPSIQTSEISSSIELPSSTKNINCMPEIPILFINHGSRNYIMTSKMNENSIPLNPYKKVSEILIKTKNGSKQQTLADVLALVSKMSGKNLPVKVISKPSLIQGGRVIDSDRIFI